MKLAGVRVLDLSSFLPGPYLSLGLADHGADVVKIEAPGEGDAGRSIGPFDGGQSIFFRNFNRGKKSIVLDLKSDAGRQDFLRLARDADVIVESSRPGVAKRLGIDFGAIEAINPRIVYCSISAFGQDGPYAARPAHDLAVEALAGTLSMNLGSDNRPALPALPFADIAAGLQGLAAVLMALYARERSGRGEYIDISMQDALVGASLNILGNALAGGPQPEVKHGRTTGGAAFYRLYDTADGRQIAIAGQEPKFVRALLTALGRQDLIALCEKGPGPHQQPVVALLSTTFAAMTEDQAARFLEPLDICWGRVNTLGEAITDAQLLVRGMLLHDEEGGRHVASPIRFKNEPQRPVLRAPRRNQDAALIGKQGETGW